MDTIEGSYRVVATPVYSDAPPDPKMPWQARVEVFRTPDIVPAVSFISADWFSDRKLAEIIALIDGVDAARNLVAIRKSPRPMVKYL